MLGFLIGLIGGIGLFMGVWAFLAKNKFIGILNVILSLGAVVSGLMMIDQRLRYDVEGSDLSYLFQQAFSEHSFSALLTVILFAAVILLSLICFIKIRKSKKS